MMNVKYTNVRLFQVYSVLFRFIPVIFVKFVNLHQICTILERL